MFKEYFKELEEESVRDNFVIIYELLDEMMDFGYPQTTESKILQEYITQEGHKLEEEVRPPPALTNAVSWRSENIKHRKNEVFLDVMESVNLLVRRTRSLPRLGSLRVSARVSVRVYVTMRTTNSLTALGLASTGQHQRHGTALRDCRRHQDEVVPQRHAGAAPRSQRPRAV